MRPEKAFVVEDLQDRFQKSPFLFVADYTGLNVTEFGDLRNRLVEAGARCQVVKNSFLRKAAATVGLPDFSDLLGGQTAVVTGDSDVCAAAKVVKKFAGETKKFTVKVGVLENKLLKKSEIDAL
ncbi:50S ribosomal protein L10, partial [Verrucomicrobia bacterium SCGC AG-212-E04]